MKKIHMPQRFATILPVIRYFFGHAWKLEKPWFALLGIHALVDGISPLVNIVCTKYIIDELVQARRPEVLAVLVALMAGINLILALARTYTVAAQRKHDTRMSLHFDRLLGRKCLDMDFEGTERREVLDRLEKAKTGMSWYSNGVGGLADRLKRLSSSLITLAGSLVILTMLSPWLILIILGVVGIKLVFTARNAKLDAQFMKELVGINRRFGYYFGLLGNFSHAKDLRLYRAQNMVEKRVRLYIDKDWKVETKRQKLQNRIGLAMLGADLVQQALLYVWLGLQVLAKAITLGEFQMLLGGAGSFAQSLSSVLSLVIDIAKTTDFMDDYRQFMAIQDQSSQGGLPVPAGTRHRFEFQDVWFAYPQAPEGTWALKGVNLTVLEGEKLSVVGENGAGKTTLIKLLCRLYDPSRGRILLDGVDIRDYALEEYWKLFGVVFQDFRFYAFTVRENLGDREGLEAALAQAGILEKVQSLGKGLDTHLYKGFEEDGVELSGGEAQKLAIARALVKKAPVSILDEPTAALDPLAEYEIYRHFDELIGGRTALYISHRLSSCRMCHRIAVFHQGELAELDTFQNLWNKPEGHFARLWQAQAQFYTDSVNT